MKISIFTRVSISLLLILAMFAPTAILAVGDGKKHFKEGMKQESSEQWDKAAEEFALAVAENPKNPEYRLHLQRSLFNASQMYMKTGASLANQGDFEGGYNAFRRAYGFDPTNELAKSEMERMVRMKQGLGPEKKDSNGKTSYVQTGFDAQKPAEPQIPQRVETLRDVPFPSGVPLIYIIRELVKELDLNVLFDSNSHLEQKQKVMIDLHQVTPSRALDYIFLQEGLFFQKVGPRTILVASNERRNFLQQMVLRTFYLANASPKDVQAVIQSAIPPQNGRNQTIVLKDDATNSVTVRDTTENIALIAKLISSLDKDRAEVVMDVAIYEVNKNDLLQFGNQIGGQASLTNLGGSTSSVVGLGGSDIFGAAGRAASAALPSAFAAGVLLPSANLMAFQNKNNTKLIASTQIHAFNNEDSSARIGQRVPVKTAQIFTGNTPTTPGNGQTPFTGDVFNYEQVGLTLKFKPLIFPNQDVQVAMEIESKDVSGPQTDTPTFTERTIKGTARIQNNKTLLLASVAQNNESNGRSGLPLVGLIPILGRLFTAPTRDNRQTDIVIAVTPRVIRAPAILPEDEVERPTGSQGTPTNGSLEAMVQEEDRLDFLASARRNPTNAVVNLPDQKPDSPTYVKTGSAPAATQVGSTTAAVPTTNSAALLQTAAPASNSATITQPAGPNLRPIDASVRTLQVKETADTVGDPSSAADDKQDSSANAAPSGEITLPATIAAMKAGEKAKIPIMVNGSAGFRSTVFGLKFDATKLAVRSVTFGDVFGSSQAGTAVTPFVNADGKMYVTMSVGEGITPAQTGVLAYIEIEALADGTPSLALDKDIVNMLAGDGRNFVLKF